MKIYNEVNDENVRKAASVMMKHCQDNQFLKLIQNVSQFNHTLMPSNYVASILFTYSIDCEITLKPYKTMNPFSSVIGYADGTTIYINERKLYLPVHERAGNLYHEFCHLAGFNHDGNRPNAYNLRTVPYLCGQLFSKYIQEIYG